MSLPIGYGRIGPKKKIVTNGRVFKIWKFSKVFTNDVLECETQSNQPKGESNEVVQP